jgi:demethylmenaquinone methyltransferase/2-methoxy-6-polyprenyl-1,4-benzoquinol methylase
VWELTGIEEVIRMGVDKSESRVRRMFGEISARYDFLNHFLSGGTDFYWRWRTVRLTRPTGSAPVLDVCTGTGDLALAYWRAGGRQIPVVGSDFTHEMLALARTKWTRLRGQSDPHLVQFVEADTQCLPFPDNHFQIVSVAFGLRNVTRTDVGLREMTRVCQPGGRVVVLEFSTPTNRLFRSIYLWYFRHVLPRIGQWFMRNEQSAYNYLPQSVSEFPQGAELAAMMQHAGLENTRWKPLTLGIATIYLGEKPQSA